MGNQEAKNLAAAGAPEDDKTAAETQTEAFGGIDAIVDAGAGYPQITGNPTADAIAGTPLDPDGHERIAKDAGRLDRGVAYEEPSAPIHLDDAENTAEVNAKAVEGAETSKERRGPKEPSKK